MIQTNAYWENYHLGEEIKYYCAKHQMGRESIGSLVTKCSSVIPDVLPSWASCKPNLTAAWLLHDLLSGEGEDMCVSQDQDVVNGLSSGREGEKYWHYRD